jgi:hypothetical protein
MYSYVILPELYADVNRIDVAGRVRKILAENQSHFTSAHTAEPRFGSPLVWGGGGSGVNDGNTRKTVK